MTYKIDIVRYLARRSALVIQQGLVSTVQDNVTE